MQHHAQKHCKISATGQKVISTWFSTEETQPTIIEVEDLDPSPIPENPQEPAEPMFPAAAHEQVKKLLQQLREGWHLHNDGPAIKSDQILNRFFHKNFPDLQCAQVKLSVKAKDKKFDIFF